MTAKEKYQQLKKYFKGHSIVALDRDEEEAEWEKSENYFADQCVQICVDEIISALKITTGHCELRRLDLHEVDKDLEYWKEVRSYAKM